MLTLSYHGEINRIKISSREDTTWVELNEITLFMANDNELTKFIDRLVCEFENHRQRKGLETYEEMERGDI